MRACPRRGPVMDKENLPNTELKMNETIELPWVMRLNFFYRLLGVVAVIFLIICPLADLWVSDKFSFVYFIPIIASVLFLYGFIRSVKCTDECITIIRGFIWSRAITWKSIKVVEMRNGFSFFRVINISYIYLSITTEDDKKYKMTFEYFCNKDIETLAELLKANAIGASLNIDYAPIEGFKIK